MNQNKTPLAVKKTNTRRLGNKTWDDSYFWLRDREDPDVISHLENENAFTEAFMGDTKAFQNKLYNEMVDRIKEDDSSAPVKIDNFNYYTRTEKDKQYQIYCRQETSKEIEEILLDVNAIAEGKSYCHMGDYKVSPCHKKIAYTLDDSGDESYKIYVKDIACGKTTSLDVENCGYTIEWDNQSQGLYYVTLDNTKRPFHVFYLCLDNLKSNSLIKENKPSCYVGLYKSKSERYIFICSDTKISSEVYAIDLHADIKTPQILLTRRDEVEYTVEHRGDYFYIVNNDNAVNFQVSRMPVNKLGLGDLTSLESFIEESEDITINNIECFQDFIVLYERKDGLKNVRILINAETSDHYIKFPGDSYTLQQHANPDFKSKKLRISYSSLATPTTVYDYDVNDQTLETVKKTQILGDFDEIELETKRLTVESFDGTLVPVSMVWMKGALDKGPAPLFLYGYGSYGICSEADFRSHRISLLKRGIIFAIAHIRGGGEMGRKWYLDGKLNKKKNTFGDFIAVGRHLVAKGFTMPSKMICMGGSAGGLLMGAVANQTVEFCAAMIVKVPFVDVINTMSDESLPLTVVEYDEWGNPNNEEDFDYIKSYSPYDNVSKKAYPNMLITGGLYDPRVSYWEPAKWAAKLREHQTNSATILLKINMEAGHGGASGRYDFLKELSLDYAFTIKTLGLTY